MLTYLICSRVQNFLQARLPAAVETAEIEPKFFIDFRKYEPVSTFRLNRLLYRGGQTHKFQPIRFFKTRFLHAASLSEAKRAKKGRAASLPSFLPFFCVSAFSILRTRLSRSLEQVNIRVFTVSVARKNQRHAHNKRYCSVGWGDSPDSGLNGKASVPFSGFRYKKGKGFHQLKYTKRQGNLSFSIFRSVKGPEMANRHILWI